MYEKNENIKNNLFLFLPLVAGKLVRFFEALADGPARFQRESRSQAQAAARRHLLPPQHAQQLAPLEPTAPRPGGADHKSQGHDAQGPERPADAQSRLRHPFGLQRLQLPEPEPADATTHHADAEPESEQQRRLALELLQLFQRFRERLAYAAVFTDA